jgi:hypothetical protein
MYRTVFLVPEVPGQDSRSIPAMLRSRPEEMRQSRRAAGVTMERVYRQNTPMGAFVIAYLESSRPFMDTMEVYQNSKFKIDADFLRMLTEVHGFDATKRPPGAGPQTLGEWFDPNVKQRGRGLAFVVPLQPGKTDATKEFVRMAWEAKVDEFQASRREVQVNGEVMTLNVTPNGDFACVYIEGQDPVAANATFAKSQAPYDTWFKAEANKLVPPSVNFNEPLPKIEQIFDWQAPSAPQQIAAAH